MNTIEALRDSLDEHAALAPNGDGLLEAVPVGATRIQRRRRMFSAAGALAAVVALALAAPAVMARLDTPARPGEPAAPYARGALQLTAALAPDSGLVALDYAVVDGVQRLGLGPDLAVEIHDPGSYDPTAQGHGETVDLGGGRAGYTIPAFLPNDGAVDGPRPAVGWRDRSGSWVVAYGLAGQESLVEAAAAVRLGPPRDVTVPYQLGYVPEGLRAVSVTVTKSPGRSTLLDFVDASGRVLLQVDSMRTDLAASPGEEKGVLVDMSPFGPPTPIAGRDTWYLTRANASWLEEQDAAGLVVRAGPGCQLFFRTAHSSALPRAAMERMVQGATFGVCADETTWTAPLP